MKAVYFTKLNLDVKRIR